MKIIGEQAASPIAPMSGAHPAVPSSARAMGSPFFGCHKAGVTARPAAPSGQRKGTVAGLEFDGLVNRQLVRLCYGVVVRTTLDISDEAYYIAKAIARDQNRSLGRVVGDLILQSSKGSKGALIEMSDYGFPTFRCARPVTTEDIRALDEEE